MWKPRACAYSRNAGVIRGANGSAWVMIADVLSGMRTLNIPPKNARGFTRFDGPRRRFLKGRIDEAVPRPHGRENPRAEAPLVPDERKPANPPGIELDFFAWLAVGDRHRRGRASKPELDDGESIERRIRQRDALAPQQLPNLRQPETVLEPAANRLLLRATPIPVVPRGRPPPGCSASSTSRSCVSLTPSSPRRSPVSSDGDIPADCLRIQPQARGDAFFRHAGPPEAEYFGDFNHPDLAIHPGPPAPGQCSGRIAGWTPKTQSGS
jgi:hypothetical protein